MADDEAQEPDVPAEDDTEPVVEVPEDDEAVAEDDDEPAAEDEPADGGDGGGGSRRGWIVGGVAAVAVACLVGLVVVVRSGDDDSAEPGTTTTTEADDDEGDVTTPSSEPPADGEEPVPGPAGLVPVDGEPWEPADVGIGGSAHGETFVSEPIGGCEGGATRTVTYDLGGGYTRLDGTLGLADDSAPGVTVEIRFSLDGAEAYWRSFVVGEASRIQLDLTGARQLTVTATRVFGGDTAPDACARAAQADLTLT